MSFFVKVSRSRAAAAVLFGACYNFLWMVFVIFVICATPLAGSDYSLLFLLVEEARCIITPCMSSPRKCTPYFIIFKHWNAFRELFLYVPTWIFRCIFYSVSIVSEHLEIYCEFSIFKYCITTDIFVTDFRYSIRVPLKFFIIFKRYCDLW